MHRLQTVQVKECVTLGRHPALYLQMVPAFTDSAPISTRTSQLSDEEVVARVRAGETALYEVVMRRYNQRLFRICRSILRDDEEAEDVIQDAYVRAYASLHQFAGRAKFSTWLAKIAVHEASSRLRKRKRIECAPVSAHQETRTMEEMKSSDLDPEQETLRREAVSFLEQAVDRLPTAYRPVFVLREIENMSTAETAGCLDLTEETVKIRLLRARKMVRQELYARAGATSSQAFQFLGSRCDRVVRRVFNQLEASHET
jgi:RNA polymerase sigma-70 factor (ECF subfamily)